MKRVIYLATRPRRIASYLAAVGIIAFLLTACAGTKGVERYYQQHVFQPVAVDSIAPKTGSPGIALPSRLTGVDQSTQKPGFFTRVFKRAPMQAPYKGVQPPYNAPKKCKGCQITYVVGDNNKVSQASAGKVKAPAVLASDSSSVTTVGENAQQQNVKGDGNTVSAKQANPTQQAKDWKAELASPVGKVVAGVAALILAGTAVYGFLLWRKKKQAETLIS